MRSQNVISLLSVVIVAQGCGSKAAQKKISAISPENQYEIGSQVTNESVSAASAGDSEGSGGFSFSLAGSGSPFKTVSRTCVVQADGSALVTISSEIEIDKSSSNANVSRVNKTTGNSTESRVWSNPGGVQCASAEKARVNLKSDPTAYSLKVRIERSRQQTLSQTNVRKNTTISSSRSFAMIGERAISIVSYSEDAASNTSIQEKKVSGSMNRSFSFVDKSGQTQSGSFSSATVGDPMVVRVKRSLSSKEVISRELVSGTRKSVLADGTALELTFSQFVMSGSGESCDAQSGSVSIKYLDSAGEATKTVNCAAESGLLNCLDQSGAAVELESPSCDPADDK
ncbi:MAG: hypothetical protein FJY29_09615 [Betaproteobacteria bacterium]|nr:hypothetical protein [Betaproteobacteria bacterium]